MRIHITDDNGHRLSFSALQMETWNSKQLAEILREIADLIELPTVEDKTLF